MMKRILLVILLFAVSVFLPSCAVTQKNTESTHDSGSGTSIYPDFYSFKDYAKYQEHVRQQIQDGKLPSNFVPASAFFILGEFVKFYHLDTPVGIYSHTVIDPNNIKLTISIVHAPQETRNPLEKLPDNTSDLRVLCGIEGNTKYVRHGLTYLYRPRNNVDESAVELLSVSWTQDGITYTLSPSRNYCNYPMDGKETILSRLLSIDENISKAAFEELKAYMRVNGAHNPGGYWAGGGILIAAAALIALLSYRRIKGISI